MVDENEQPEEELISRAPTPKDLAKLCAELNARNSRYVVVGGFAIRGSGLLRETHDVDLLINADIPNVTKVYKALETLPDKAVLELEPHDVAEYIVVRIGDEITVDLMASAGGYTYDDIIKDAVIREVQGVPIPFASPRMLYKMKEKTHRAKDQGDLHFLRTHYADEIFGKD